MKNSQAKRAAKNVPSFSLDDLHRFYQNKLHRGVKWLVRPGYSDAFDWWKKEACALVKETGHTNRPDIDYLALDLMGLCLSMDRRIYGKISDAEKRKIATQRRKYKQSLDTVIEQLDSDAGRTAIRIRTESQNIVITPDLLVDTLKCLRAGHVKDEENIEKYKQQKIRSKTWLITKMLPCLYKRHFNEDWKFSRPPDGGEPYGPGIRFSKFCLNRLEIETTSENIASLYKRHKGKK